MLNTRPLPDQLSEDDASFNINKLEAVVCIVLSVCISVTLIVLAFRVLS
jgi:hypothetical protein